jgi:hypothetical protein
MDTASWSDNHYVGSAMSGAAPGGYVFCVSCWDAVESWFLNTNIDKAMFWLCSATSSITDQTHVAAGGDVHAETSVNGNPCNPIGKVCQYVMNVSTSIGPGV